MKTFEGCVSELYRQPYGEAAWLANVQWALEAIANERAEARRGQIRIDNPTIGMIAPPIDGLSPERTARLYEEHREVVNALMAERAAAPNRLAQSDADELAGEPRSYSHWGMHA